MIRLVVSGARGRMGRRIKELAERDSAFQVIAGLELTAEPAAGIERRLEDIKKPYDCIIEFTTPGATVAHAKKTKKAMVIGTTGFSKEEIEIIKETSKKVPIVLAPNMSVGVNVCMGLIEAATKILGREYKVKIKETHHVHKKDRPSGTAKLMAQIVKEAGGNIGMQIESKREDEVVGDHEIIFESDVDTIKISHSAKTRDIFAVGALQAAKFVITKNRGLFSMRDVLGLNQERK